MTNIIVATSIPPKMERLDGGRPISDYQRMCIRSWLACGFRVLSINDASEIPALSAKFPEVEFIPTDRNASEWTGRKNPYIADLLAALLRAPEPVKGIINADILFEPSNAWREKLPPIVGDYFVVAQRRDTSSLHHGAYFRCEDGGDGFFFDASFINAVLPHAMPFAMGVNWWDVWLTLMATFNRQLIAVDRPATVHLIHPKGFTRETVATFCKIAGESITEAILRARETPELINATFPNDRATDEMNASIFNLLGRVSWPDNWSAFNPLFHDLGQRMAAGDALRRADKLITEERYDEAEIELRIAAKYTPQDQDALKLGAKLAWKLGNRGAAAQLLMKARHG